MVTKLSDGRGQTTIKGKEIDDEWEALIRKAAERTGRTIAGFVVDHTTAAAQAIIKNELAVPAALPARIEEVAASLQEQLARLAAEQADRLDRIAFEQRDRLDRASAEQNDRLTQIVRQARRGRWRR
jgi:uncharacterized protein (DUF1778 family)